MSKEMEWPLVKQTVQKWIEALPEGKYKRQALLKLSPKCAFMVRDTIFDAILCARSCRESIEIYNDPDDFWMKVYNEISPVQKVG